MKTMVEEGLVVHCPFDRDCADHSGTALAVRNHGVELGGAGPTGAPGAAARFNGDGAYLEAADHPVLRFGTADFTIAAWVRADDGADVAGGIAGKFDPAARRGLDLSIVTNGAMTSTAQSNYRNLHFGIDNGRLQAGWTDCGRPGHAVLVAALKVSGGRLFAGTLETGPQEKGRLWRYEGGREWADLGNPVGCNVVHSVAEFDGALYCGLGRYICEGSLLGETLNRTPGGRVYRVDSDGRWTCCGRPGAEDATPEDAPVSGYSTGKADDVIALSVYQGELYGVSNHRRGVFRYEGDLNWKYLGPDLRVLSLAVYRGRLYALVNGGPVYRHEGGTEWALCGRPGASTQTYGAVIHGGRLYVGTWPDGTVHRYEGEQTWSPEAGRGRVGCEREIMAMALYNGKVYLGSLPTANVWRMDGERFTFVGSLDFSPAPLRRVWTMAVYSGKLFAGTLPSGRVLSIEAGKAAGWDRAFPAGWRHVAAVRGGRRLRLYVDAELVARSAAFEPADYDLSNDCPLQIGFGAHEHFRGLMSDLRVYNRALDRREVARLARL